MTAAVHRSRINATVEALGAASNQHRFAEKAVLLTGSVEALLTANGEEMTRSSLQLLMRLTSNLDVAIPEECERLAISLATDSARFAWDVTPRFVATDAPCAKYDAILSIGGNHRPEPPWTTIAASGWLARATSGPTPIDGDCSEANSITALAAASLGVSEVFKHLIRVAPDVGELIDATEFSLWDFAAGGANGPPLPSTLDCNLMVNGAGAIGSALIHGLAQLPLTGAINIVDRQRYGEENWGTCLDLERGQVGQSKAKVAASRLPETLDRHAFEREIVDVVENELGSKAPWPRVVLNGLDGVDARHDAQSVWPDLVIDGALDADLQVRTSVHPHASDMPCLICTYDRPSGESHQIVAARATGLALESLANQDRPLSQADVDAASPEARDRLSKHIGRIICSIVSEAVLTTMSTDESLKGFSPSVPFAASFAASLELAKLVRYLMTGEVGGDALYQMSLLWGPEKGDLLRARRKPRCVCVTQRRFLDQWREARAVASISR